MFYRKQIVFQQVKENTQRIKRICYETDTYEIYESNDDGILFYYVMIRLVK